MPQCIVSWTAVETITGTHPALPFTWASIKICICKCVENQILAVLNFSALCLRGWSGGAMALGKLPVPGRPTIWITEGQGPTAFAVGAGGGCLYIFTLIYPFCPLSPSLWETARYRLKYCLKGPLNLKQPTNQPLCLNRLYRQN